MTTIVIPEHIVVFHCLKSLNTKPLIEKFYQQLVQPYKPTIMHISSSRVLKCLPRVWSLSGKFSAWAHIDLAPPDKILGRRRGILLLSLQHLKGMGCF